jgi:hypothetical protein
MVWAAVTGSWMSFQEIFLSFWVWCFLCFLPPPPSSLLDLPVRDRPSSWSVGWCQSFLAETQIGLGWSCEQTQINSLPVVRKGSSRDGSKFHPKDLTNVLELGRGGANFGVCQWRQIGGCLEFL